MLQQPKFVAIRTSKQCVDPGPNCIPFKEQQYRFVFLCCGVLAILESLAGQSHKIQCPFLVAAVTGLPAGSEVPKGRAASERFQQAGREAALQQPGATGAEPWGWHLFWQLPSRPFGQQMQKTKQMIGSAVQERQCMHGSERMRHSCLTGAVESFTFRDRVCRTCR